jgi:hypothetical protein
MNFTERMCATPGCTRRVKGKYSKYCEQHSKALSRHGDPRQIGIKKHELKPFIQQVRHIIKKDKTAKIEAGLNKIRNLLEDTINNVLDNALGMYSYKRKALLELQKVIRDATAIDLGATIGALYLLREWCPRSFKSDNAFWFQLARQVRRLSPMGVGSYYNEAKGNTTTVYKDIPPKVTAIIGQYIVEYYKPFIAHIVIKSREETARAQQAEDLIREGFTQVA